MRPISSSVRLLPSSRPKYSRSTFASSGDGYDVRWLVVKRGTTYKVRDAQVIGFWMTSFLDNLFQSFISDNGGNPKALVVALNR